MNMFYAIEEERKGRGWDFENNRSVNATNAYLEGERPISYWTKGAILKLLVERGCCPDVIAKLKGMPLWLMKDLFLSESATHHIGKRFKPVMFFWVDEWPENLDKFYNLILKRKYRFCLQFISDEKAKKWAKEMISEYYDNIISEGERELRSLISRGSPEQLKRWGYKIKGYTY
jgi:hypothetical protein